MFNQIRESNNRSIILSFIVGYALGIVGFGLYPSPIWTLLEFVFVIWLIVLRMGGLRSFDIGMRRDKVLEGLVFTVVLWALWELGEIATGLAAGKPIAFNPDFTGIISGPTQHIPFQAFITSVFFFALNEEIFYRGYLIPQFSKKLRRRFPKQSDAVIVILSVLIIAVFFALSHIVVRLQNGVSAADLFSLEGFALPSLFLRSLLFSFIFLRTDNLFAVLGVHALSNSIPLLFAYRNDETMGIIYLGLLLAVAWSLIRAAWMRRRNVPVLPPQT